MSTVEGWKKVRICEFGTIVTGSTPDTKNDSYWGGDVPFVSPADFKSSVFIEETARTLSNAGVKQARLIPQNSILVTCIGSIGGIAIASCSCVTNQQINSIVCAERFEDRFIFYVVQHNISKLIELAGTTTLPIINKNTFGDIEIVLSTFKPEQTKIAEVLSTVDQAIEQTEALIAKQQRIKSGLMQDLLTRGIDEHGNLRSEQTHEFKDSLLKGVRIPISWIDGEFRKVTSVNQGLQIPIEKRFKEEGPNRHKYITVQYLNNPDKYLEYIEKPPFQLVCSEGDILFTRTGNTGQIITGVEGVYHNNFFKVAYDKTKVYGDYLVQFLNWQPIQELIRELAGTTTIPDLNHGDFYSLPLFLPQIDEQKLISELLRTQNADLSTESRKLAKLRSLKTALMQDLLTGKKRVTPLLDSEKEATA